MKNKKTKKILIILSIILAFAVGIIAGNVLSKVKLGETASTSTTTQITEVTVGTQIIENTLTSSGEILSSGIEKLELSTSKYFKIYRSTK